MEELQQLLSVWLTSETNEFLLDVSDCHIFLGYKPVIIAVVFDAATIPLEKIDLPKNPVLRFQHDDDKGTRKNVLAQIKLKKIKERKTDTSTVIFFEGIEGRHNFIKTKHQIINDFREKLKLNKAGNIDLPGNLHDMVRIAYSFPRIISIITLSEGETMNMFPTDLHGVVSQKYYLSSLRIGGKANEQVETIKRIALSNVDANDFNSVYLLGKNHMQKMLPKDHFTCSDKTSLTYKIPLPTSVLNYRELSLVESFDVGIHRIHLYEIVGEYEIKNGVTLAHVHQYYAQWRMDNGLQTDMLLRR